MIPYCSYCGGRTDGFLEVGARICICLTHCPWCGHLKPDTARAHDDEKVCRCDETAQALGVTPPPQPKGAPPTVPWDITDEDRHLLRGTGIDLDK